jgi:hypothetical protein
MAINTPVNATPPNQSGTGTPVAPFDFQAPTGSSGAEDVNKALDKAKQDALDAMRFADGMKKINMAVMTFLAEVEKANKWFEKASA